MTDNWERGAHAALMLARSRAQNVRCEYCNAQVGEPCVSRTGYELHHQPAHLARLQDAQAAP
jgi:hypothetical protein